MVATGSEGCRVFIQRFLITVETEEELTNQTFEDINEYMGLVITEAKEIIIQAPEEPKGCVNCIYGDKPCLIRDIGELETCTAMYKPKES